MKIKNVGVILGILLLAATAAYAVVNPSNNAVNPSTNTIYVPDNDTTPEATPGVRVYKFDNVTHQYWIEQPSKRIALPAKSYGLAVWQGETEGKLLISVSNGTSSKLRSVALDGQGLPTSYYSDVDITHPLSSPMGIAILSTGDRAYLADPGNERLYYFKYTTSGGWMQENYTVTGYKVNSIALTPAQNTYTMRYVVFPPPGRFVRELSTSTYKIFVTVKDPAGKVLIYNYNLSGGTETITKVGEITGLSYPTYVKVSPQFANKLFVALRGSSGGDMKIYNITTAEPYLTNARTVSSIPGAYGWTGFDVSYSENYLFFSQAANIEATQTYIYRVALPLSGDYTVTDSDKIATLNKNIDGLALNKAYTRIVGTYSGDGSITGAGTNPFIDTGVNNHSPNLFTDLTNMGQFVYPEGTTAIPEGGPTTQNRVIVKFRVSDPDGDNVFPQIEYHRHGGPNNFINLPAVPNGTTVTATIPASGVLENGEWEWGVGIKDYTGGTYSHRYFGDNLGVTDFVIDFADITPPAAVTNLAAVPGSSAGDVNLTWTAPGDDGMGGMVSGYEVKYITSTTALTDAFTTPAGYNDPRATTRTFSSSTWPGLVAGGGTENRTLTGLPYDSGVPTYIYIAMKARDEVPNWGGMSNVASTFVRDHIPAPVITLIYPNRAPTNTTQTVVIEGNNFWGTPTVTLTGVGADIAASSVTLNSINQLTCTLNLTGALPGVRNVVVANPDLQSATATGGFEIIASGSDTQAPVLVANFSASDGEDTRVTLTWNNPADPDLREIVVRKKADSYPANHSDGSIAYRDLTPRPGTAISSVDAAVTNGTTYYYAVFSRDTSDNWNDTVDQPPMPQSADTGTPGGGPAADVPRNLTLIKSGNDAILNWEVPTAGEPGGGYRVYRGTSPTTITNLVGEVLAGTHTLPDTGAVTTPDSYYYVARSFTGPTESGPSNVAYLLKLNWNPTPSAISNMYWISIPYNTPLAKARDIANDINGTKTPGDPGTCVEVGKFDTATGVTETLTWYGDTWFDTATSDDQGFSVVTGESYYVGIVGNTTWIPSGSDNPDFQFNLTPVGTNMYWVSLPYNGDYTNARSIVDHINTGIADPANYIVTEIGKFNPETGATETLTWYGDVWYDTLTSDDQGFAFVPGEGYYISVFQPLNNWAPRRK